MFPRKPTKESILESPRQNGTDVSGRIREAIETRRTPMVVTEKATSANGSATLDKTVKTPEAEKPDTVYGPVEDECFGKRIRKSFGSRAFWGTIVASYVVGNGVFYKVSFDDGDVDILSAGEVYHDLSAAKRHADEDASQKEPEAERVLTGGASPSSPTRFTYADALRSRKSSLKRRRDSSDSETQDEVSAGSPWNVKLWSSRLFATIMEEDGFIRVQDFVTMPNGEPGEMESTGKVRPGDAMLAVQGRIVHGVMDHMQACDLIRTLPRPLTLTFIRPPENEGMAIAIVDAAIEKIQAAASESQDTQSPSKKPRVDPLPSAASTSESLHPHSAPAPPSTSASGIPPRQPSPEVQIVGVSRPPSSAAASHIQRHAPVPVQHPRPAFSGPPSSLPANVSAFVPSGPRGPTIFQSHVSGLGRYHPQHQNRSRTPSPGPPSAGCAQNSGPLPHQPSHQETTQMSGSSLVATVRIPAHFASSTSAPFPSSSNQVVSQSGLAFTVPHPEPQAYQRPEQATLNESRSGVHSNQNVVHRGTQSFGQYGQHPAVTSSAPPFNQLVNHQRGSGNLPIQASGSASVAGLSLATPTHGNTTTAQEVRYTYSRQIHGSMPLSGSSLGHISTGPMPPTHAVSTNSFQRVPSRQESSEDDRARNMTLGDYMVYTAQRERLALRNNAASQRTHQALHSTRQPQPQHTVPSSTPTQHQAEPRTLQPPIAGVPAVRQERSTPDEATQGASFETFDDVLAQVVSGAAGSTGSSFLSLKETSYLADIPMKQRASRMNRITGRSDASLSARATSYAPPRPHYLSKYDVDEVVEVTISKQRLYVTLGHMGQNISISSFVRGGDGEVGEIEASGKVLTGDILVGVGSVQIPAFISPGEVARIVNTQPRPCTAYFIRATWEMLE